MPEEKSSSPRDSVQELVEDVIEDSTIESLNSVPEMNPGNQLLHRTPSVTS